MSLKVTVDRERLAEFDLHTEASLSRHFRGQVFSESQDQYVAA